VPINGEAEREGIMRKFLLFSLVVMSVGCKKPMASIRDPNVYANEIDFLRMAITQQTSLLEYHLQDGSCVCVEQEWTVEECEKTAKSILVMRARLDWHLALMEYNGSLREDRPPKDPPEIPESTTLCPEKAEEPAPEPEQEPEKPAGESTEGSEGGI